MDSCDVLIVGGGPAGSSCAWGLRSSGLDVLVVDRARFPREKLCGGWITPLVLSVLEIDPSQYGRGRVLQPITGFRVGAMGQPEVAIDCDEIVSYGIRRCEFDEYLLRRCGARARERFAVKTIERTSDGWIVNNEIRTRLLVGAGGHFCPVSRLLGATDAEAPVVAQEVEFQMSATEVASCNILGEVPELYFCRDLAGYGWCFRKNDFLNIGLGRIDRHRLPEHLRRFVESLIAAGKIKLDRELHFAGHAYLLFGHSPRRVVDDSLLIVGDSAGLAFAESGEGIRPAIESGLLAAQVISTAQGSYTHERLESYRSLLRARFNRRRDLAERTCQYLPRSLRNFVARILLRRSGFCEVVVRQWFLRENVLPLKFVAPSPATTTARSA